MNRIIKFIKSDLKKLAYTLVFLIFVFCSFNTTADDDLDIGTDDIGDDFGDDFSGDDIDFDDGDTDIGDVVIIDDSVNIYDDGIPATNTSMQIRKLN